MNRLVLHILLGIWLLGAAASCTNDALFDEPGTVIPEGKGHVSVQLKFRPLSPALETGTRTAGTAIKSIRSLCVLFYDEQGRLIEKRPVTDYDLDEEENRDSTTEPKTPCATFDMTVPYGRYYIYAVANMGDLADYETELQTVEGLKHISFDWKDEVSANSQMFGHFTERGKVSDEAPLLTIARKEMALHAWLRRAASKVTVAFNGTRLEEGVFIYLKSVQIKDIPSSCLLGADNTPTELEQLIADGETITYVEGTNYDENWPARITKGRPFYPYDEESGEMRADAHAEQAQALFFYENMQGTGDDKQQDWKVPGEITYPDGNDPTKPGYKDNMSCGTYIEVKAFYRSINDERIGSGDIVYRFMLGKDVHCNYDAERNYHYKLTLHFNRFANDVDWHIDYKEVVPSIQVPDPYYISYLYNHSMNLPIKINAGPYKVTRLTARIDSNAWAPYEAYGTLDYYWRRDPAVNKNQTEAPNCPWNGFLSLRQTKDMVIAPEFTGDVRLCNQMNKDYYEEHHRGDRTYELGSGWHRDKVDGDYYVEPTEEDGEHYVTLQLPMYTRAKQLIIKSGYTGNNPYEAYRRRAVVTFTATLEGNGEKFDIEKSTSILQVRRVVNPKGIWRKHNSTKPFRVVLKYLPSEKAEQFVTFTSEGAWRAYVVCGDKNFVTLDGGAEARGSTGSPIDFMVGFQGTCKADESRCAIIRVEYHNYSCYHLIFVRQGKAPLELVENGTKWHACNMRTGTEEADCPVEEGSLFKFGNWGQPIDATSNVNDKTPWTSVTAGDFLDHASTLFSIAGTTDESLWSGITYESVSNSFSDPTIDGHEVTVATYDDYEELWENEDIAQGYGVLYGDDATETLSDIEEVYGHRHDKHGDATTAGSGYGMRGCFVYNKSETSAYGGRNLFFPIGTSGYGHRKHAESDKTAVLRYAAGRTAPMTTSDFVVDRPLFYDLYLRPGAIYWLREEKTSGGREPKILGWDFNYFTFDFNYVGTGNLIRGGGSDACFVRCVEKK